MSSLPKIYIEKNEQNCINYEIYYEEKYGYDGYSEMVLEKWENNDFLKDKDVSIVHK